MRKLGWYATSALVVALIAGCVLLLSANLYVQSQAVQQRIRAALTRSLRMPVRIAKTTVTPWEGLRIDGISAQPALPATEVNADAPRDTLTAASFRIKFQLSTLLLQRRLVVSEVLLDQPGLRWTQDSTGRWRFPQLPDKSRSTDEPSVSPPPSAPDDAAAANVSRSLPPTEGVEAKNATPSESNAQAPSSADSSNRPSWLSALNKVRLRHGDLTFLNGRNRPVGEFQELNLDGKLSDANHLTGTLSFAKARLPRLGLILSDFDSDFEFNHDTGLSLKRSHAKLAGGDVSADWHLQTSEPNSPYSLKCHLDNVAIGQLIRETGSRLKLLDGRMQGEMHASGTDDPASRHVRGNIELLDAKVRDFPTFRVLGEVLGIEDLSHLEFKEAQMSYELTGTTLQVDPLVLTSNDLKITAQGKYFMGADRLDMHARLSVDGAVSHRMPAFVAEQFHADGGDTGGLYIDFDVAGPASKPTTNLYKRVVAPRLDNLLHDWLAPKSKTSKERFLKRPANGPTPSISGAQPAN